MSLSNRYKQITSYRRIGRMFHKPSSQEVYPVYDIVNRNLTKLSTIIGSKLGHIDVFKEIIQDDLSIWISIDALIYTKHKLSTCTSIAEVDSERMILSWLDIPPDQIAIRSHFYLHSKSGLLMSAMNNWPIGFRALLAKKIEQTINLYP